MEILDSTAFAAFALGLFFGYWMGFGTLSFANRGNNSQAIDTEALLAKLSPQALLDIKDSLRGRRKIEAIKIMRTETGAGLRESKLTVEKLWREMKQNEDT